jgi:predicted aconitase
MTVSQDRIAAIGAALKTLTPTPTTVTPTQAQLDAAFAATSAAVMALVQQLVPAWAMGDVNITVDEIHAISDPTAAAVVNAGASS